MKIDDLGSFSPSFDLRLVDSLLLSKARVQDAPTKGRYDAFLAAKTPVLLLEHEISIDFLCV